jgi:hypothetical protein
MKAAWVLALVLIISGLNPSASDNAPVTCGR